MGPPAVARVTHGRVAAVAAAGACAYVAGSAIAGAANLALLLLVAASVVAASAEPRSTRPRGPLVASVAFLGLSTLLSTATSVDPSRSLHLAIPLVPGALLFLLVGGYLERRHLRGLYATVVAVSLVMAVRLLWVAWQDPWAGPIEWTETADLSWLVVRNDVGFFAAVLPLALALALRPSRRGLDVLGAVAAVAGASVVVVYQSRGGVVATLVVLGAWAVGVRRRAALTVVAIAATVMVGLDAAAGFPLASRVAETWVTRVHVWLAALDMFFDAPFLGQGPRSFGVLFLDYFGTETLPAWLPADPRFSPWAHNLWLETLAEQGLVGFGALSLVVAFAGRTVVGLARAADEEVRRLALGAAVALLAMGVEAFFELSFIRLWVVVVFFALLGAIAALDADVSAGGDGDG